MSDPSPAAVAWETLSRLPGGKRLLSRLVVWKAPYAASIQPRFEELGRGYCKVHVRKRRRVLNHIGTIHAIAMCNMVELVAGTMMSVSVPSNYRWIPKGMTVEYLAKANSDLDAVVELDTLSRFCDCSELLVPVRVTDIDGQVVLRAVITMWLTESPKR